MSACSRTSVSGVLRERVMAEEGGSVERETGGAATVEDTCSTVDVATSLVMVVSMEESPYRYRVLDITAHCPATHIVYLDRGGVSGRG